MHVRMLTDEKRSRLGAALRSSSAFTLRADRARECPPGVSRPHRSISGVLGADGAHSIHAFETHPVGSVDSIVPTLVRS
jgi:hypothetical protein